MNPTNQPVSFYGDNSRNTDSALLAAIATKQPYEYDYAGMIGAGGISDLREEVKDVGSNVRSDIGELKAKVGEGECRITGKVSDLEARVLIKLGDVECKVIKENSDQTLYLTNQLSVIREQGIRNEYETKLSREQVIKELGAKIDHKSERLEDKVEHSLEEVREDLCALSKQLAKCCCEDELAAANIQNGLVNIQDILTTKLK